MDRLAEKNAELPAGWHRVAIPLPYALKEVNAYLLADAEGWTLIDPGLRTEEAESRWLETLGELGIRFNDIRQIVLTHHHPDHYGLAGWFQVRTGAPVYLSEVAFGIAQAMWSKDEMFSDKLAEAFVAHGLPQELTPEMMAHMRGFRERVSPQPTDIRLLAPGDHFRMGGAEWQVIGGEGHAPGQLLFLDQATGRLICGDQVLPDISPNIGWFPGGDPNPLQSYLDSLELCLKLDVNAAYPGHRAPFRRFHERVRELRAHHERRLVQMTELFAVGSLTAFEVCELSFGARLRNTPHQLRFALAETIAHLVLLVDRGILRCDVDRAGAIRYVR